MYQWNWIHLSSQKSHFRILTDINAHIKRDNSLSKPPPLYLSVCALLMCENHYQMLVYNRYFLFLIWYIHPSIISHYTPWWPGTHLQFTQGEVRAQTHILEKSKLSSRPKHEWFSFFFWTVGEIWSILKEPMQRQTHTERPPTGILTSNLSLFALSKH